MWKKKRDVIKHVIIAKNPNNETTKVGGNGVTLLLMCVYV